jgi:hypothetical protein
MVCIFEHIYIYAAVCSTTNTGVFFSPHIILIFFSSNVMPKVIKLHNFRFVLRIVREVRILVSYFVPIGVALKELNVLSFVCTRYTVDRRLVGVVEENVVVLE